MTQRIQKQYLTGLSIEVTTLIALLLAIFTPKINILAGRVLPQLYLALIFISISALIAIFCKRYMLFPNSRILMLGSIFPLYLFLLSTFNSTVVLSFLGQSDRHLGAVTYLTTYIFYFVGVILKLNRSGAFARILIIISCLEVLQLVSNYLNKLDVAKTGVFGNNNAESFFFCILMIFVSIYVLEELKSKILIGVLGILTLSFAILFIAFIGSVQGIVGFIATIFIYCVFKVSNQNLNFPRLLGFLLSGTVIAFTTVILIKDIPSDGIVNTDSFYERLEIYKTAGSGFIHSGIFGVGVDQFNELYYKYNLSENLKLVDNAHSIPLQVLSTLGLIGLLLWSLVFILALNQSPQNLDPESKAMYFSILAYLITGLIAIQVVGIEFLVFFVLGGLMANGAKVNKFRSSSVSKWVQVCALTLIVTISSLQLIAYTKVTNTLTKMSQGAESYTKNSETFLEELNTVYDFEILLKAGRLSIVAQDKRLGLLVMERLINLNPIDQRSIALTLELAEKWSDTRLFDLGNSLNVGAK